MFETARQIVDFIAYALGQAPALSVVLGLIASLLLTQLVKPFILPGSEPIYRQTATRVVAMAIGVWVAALVNPTSAGLIAGLCAGLGSPYLYRVGIVVVGWRWPDLRQALSQDSQDQG